MHIIIPEFSLVILIGTSGAGKSTFARKHFLPTEIVSSDHCRALVSDNENDSSATADAFDLLHYLVAKRLKRRLMTVVDATNVQPEGRKSLIALAREYHCPTVAIVLEIPLGVCYERNAARPDRDFGQHVIRRQHSQLRRSMRGLKGEGVRFTHRLHTPEEVDAVQIVREKMWPDKREEHGPFDIIGDVHGCCDELEELLRKLGYEAAEIPEGERDAGSAHYSRLYRHPEGRKALFVGDLVDRGPRVLDTLLLARNMVAQGTALCVPGNHDVKLLKKLQGRSVQVRHGLQQTLAELEALPQEILQEVSPLISKFIDSMVSHYVLDDGNLVAAHAGMKEQMQGRASQRIREFALFGETTGETDEFGLPVRYNWAAEYRGAATVVYGHTPVPEPEWLNNTINIDTGCVFGGKLTALRYPEREIVSVPARQIYAEPIRPIASAQPNSSAQQAHDTLLNIGDVLGKRIVQTELMGNITIRAENAAAALEVMSRFAVDPRWLIYLPPTMSPVQTSSHPEYLERPEEAFEYYRGQGIDEVVCQEKHMGSRAVAVICRNSETARKRFGVSGKETGMIYTRTGRRFFTDHTVEASLIEAVAHALTATNFWEEMETDWVCLDCELMPWSAKAQELLQEQYGAVRAAAQGSLAAAEGVLAAALERGLPVESILERNSLRRRMIGEYAAAYGRYCWPVDSLNDLRLAPFHILGTEGAAHTDKNHLWHMQTIEKFANGHSPLFTTAWRTVNVNDEESVREGSKWWEELTGAGSEGMVVKPLDFIAQGKRGIAQPAVKVRGREYLRIIYGPEYTRPDYLERLRSRGLAAKRSLAAREFALGVEALRRFVHGSPLRLVHEAVFGVLALESEPVDPRL